jgi:predicted DNA-binding transcriptional regulator AlpA
MKPTPPPRNWLRDAMSEKRIPKYMSLSELAFELDISESSLEAWIKARQFPAPKRMGPRGMRRWLWKEVEAYIEQCSKEADPHCADKQADEARRIRDATIDEMDRTDIRKRH